MPKNKVETTEKFTLKVLKSGKEYVQDIERDQIFVVVGIFNSKKEKVSEKRFGYELELTTEEITTDLEKVITNYNNEYKFNLSQKSEDDAHAQADETLRELEDLELS